MHILPHDDTDAIEARARACGVPEHLVEGLALYVAHGFRPGSFLQAVLANDLMDAVNRGDEDSRAGLVALCVFISHALPAQCHGSRERVAAWIEAQR
jgi:hypothetical protein